MSFKLKQRWMNRTAPDLKPEESKINSSGQESSEDDTGPPILSPAHANSSFSPSTKPKDPKDDSIPPPPKKDENWTSSVAKSTPVEEKSKEDDNSKKNSAESEAKVAEALSAIQLIDENTYLFTRSQNNRRKTKHTRMSCDCSPPTEEEKSQGLMGCGEDCLNRMLFVECTKCPSGNLCGNRRMQKKTYSEVEPFDAGDKGVGLRAKKTLYRNDFVIEYVGEVLDAQQFKSRMKRYGRDDTHKHHYFMGLQRDEVIDATVYGNISRFINHSCDPNAETQKWTVDGELRIGFFAIRTIEPGEEITFDYQFQRYGKEAQVCLCGSANCRGFIGNQATEEEGQANKEIAKERKLKEKRRRAYLEDIAMEEDMKTLEKSGTLRTREDVLTFSRLMVRGVDFESRMKLLDMAQRSEEQPLRLFLDYHGCKLIWSWLVDDEHMDSVSMLKLQRELLRLLSKLPIPHRNMLEESRILRVITRWAQTSPPVPTSNDGTIETAVKKTVRFLVDTVSGGETDIDVTPSGSSCSSSINGDEISAAEENNPEFISSLIQEESRKLLDKWSDLKEYFKIPKKTEAAKAARVGKIAERTYRIENHSPLTPKLSKNVLDNAAAMSYNKTVFNRGQPTSSTSYGGRRLPNGADLSGAFLSTNRYVAAKKDNLIKKRKRSNSGSNSPSSARKRPTSPRRKGDSRIDDLRPAPPPPLAVRKRPSRFDRKTPPEAIKPLTKEERRRLFEQSVMKGSNAVQEHFMTTDFQMDAAAIEEDMVTEQMDMLKDDNMIICSSPETSSPTSSCLNTTASTPSFYHPTPFARFPPGKALPALFVVDPRTNVYWWQDQASGTLVYQVSPDQVSQRLGALNYLKAHGRFLNEGLSELLTPYQDSAMTRSIQSRMQELLWERAKELREARCPKRSFDAPPQRFSESEKEKVSVLPALQIFRRPEAPKNLYAVKLTRIHRGDWSKTPHFVYDMNTGLVHESPVVETVGETKLDAIPIPETKEPVKTPEQDVEDPGKKKEEPAGSPKTSTPTVLNPSEQIRALEAQIRELQKQVAKKNTEPELEETPTTSNQAEPTTTEETKQRISPDKIKSEPVEKTEHTVPQGFKPIKINIKSAISVPAKSPVLPPNWKTAFDEEGNPYYYHTITREVQWEFPVDKAEEGTPVAGPSVEEATPSPAVTSVLSPTGVLPPLGYNTSGLSSAAEPAIPLIEPFPLSSLTTATEKKPKPVEAVIPFIPVQSEPAIEADSSSFHPESTTEAADTSSEVTRKQKEEFKTTISKYIVKCLHPYKKDDCKVGRIESSEDFKHLARKLSHTIMEKELKRCNNRYEDLKATDNVRKKAKDYVKLYMKKLGPVYSRTANP